MQQRAVAAFRLHTTGLAHQSNIFDWFAALLTEHLNGTSIGTSNGISVGAAISIALFLTFWYRTRRQPRPSPNPALIALQTILVPTQSRWPAPFLVIVNAARTGGKHIISIPLTLFLESVCSGAVELRKPARDLPSLVKSCGLNVHGWTIVLEVDWKTSVEASEHWHSLPLRTARGFNPESAVVTLHTRGLSAENDTHVVDMDLVPLSELQSTLRHLSTYPSGTKFEVLVTTRAPGPVPQPDSQVVKNALPFFPRSGSAPRPSGLTRAVEHDAAFIGLLEAQLCRVAGLSTLGFEEISRRYADSVRSAVRQVEDHRDVRTVFLSKKSVEVWRADRLYGDWEAALLDAGMLRKWKVSAVKNYLLLPDRQ
ncbi:hypothetical protein FA95DRAFT_1414693 [Auriscalpium vulgare]|uniref:Uncharacterized protein n=1 Tax=Auriscalpium vulgare TaxID=40419 RepID=A0ACB8RQ22_9AGAM|nr:hypothetical protein FA95DRAFT_1414693 [Auriscalpium vulgare]